MNVQELIDGVQTEELMVSILGSIHTEGPIYPQVFETLAYLKKFHPKVFEKYESRLMHLMGLFYKTSEPVSLLEEVYSLYAETIKDETGRRFTPVQASAYKKIADKTYFSFSAPTSSGKSFLFRELILNAINDIVIVVPSRALIAEYMYAVIQLVRDDKSVLVLQFIENINTDKTNRRVYVITPERGDDLFKLIYQLEIGLFLFDEAQISEENLRGMKFDSFVRRVDRLVPGAKKVFAHPFILNPEAQLAKHNFNNNSDYKRYDQNTVGKIYILEKHSKFKYFSPFENVTKVKTVEVGYDPVVKVLERKGTLLIYTSKKKIYDGTYILDFGKYIEMCPKVVNKEAQAMIEELREYIGASERIGEKHSIMIDMMEKGIVIHHGSMPLRARLLIERFVNNNYANICFATSTLAQGINMPFDIVWIDNFRFQGSENRKNLDLKNLIGRAGRTTAMMNAFDYGYVVIGESNVSSFRKRMQGSSSLSETSAIDDELSDITEDLRDIAEAIKDDSFDSELQLTTKQIERLINASLEDDVLFLLDTFLLSGKPITGKEYYELSDSNRNDVKASFKKLYVSHLRRTNLTKGEASVLSVSIPILLWRIQGKSFKEIVSLRHAFLTHKDQRREILSRLKAGVITSVQATKEVNDIEIRYSTVAHSLPDLAATTVGLFPRYSSVKEFDYDILVYDTYDYIDKVLSLSLTDPLTAVFQLFYDKTGDLRALAMKNYIRYGTNDETEIWLLRYGFGFDEIEWIKPHVKSISERCIVFLPSINKLKPGQYEIISRYT